jgi:TPR repeat protein
MHRPAHKLECRAPAPQPPLVLTGGSGQNQLQVAFAVNLRLADQGDAAAMFRVAVAYFEGCGVVQSQNSAKDWFLRSSKLGCVAAQGCCARYGFEEPQNPEKGHKLMQRAADMESAAEILYMLGSSFFKAGGAAFDEREGVRCYREAVRCYRTAADKEYAPAQNGLGICFERGFGVAQDVNSELGWLVKAANQGFSKAQFNLAVRYHLGKGVSKDDCQAVHWFRLAAEQGNAGAQFNLGNFFSTGSGVVRDDVEAVKWFRLAAEQGHLGAQLNLGHAYCY